MWQKIMILKPRKVRNQLWQNFQLNKWFSFQRIQNPTLAICRTSSKYHLMLDGKQIKLFEISYSTLLQRVNIAFLVFRVCDIFFIFSYKRLKVRIKGNTHPHIHKAIYISILKILKCKECLSDLQLMLNLPFVGSAKTCCQPQKECNNENCDHLN